MSGYILILMWLGALGILSGIINIKHTEIICGKKEQRYDLWFAIIVFLPVIIWAGTRTSFADTAAYIKMYDLFPDSLGGMRGYISVHSKDVGFSILGIIIKSFWGENFLFFFFIIALIQGIILICFYRKYSKDYVISMFLFIATAEYLSWMFNGIRQFLAVTIVVAATPLMLKKKYIPLIVTILLAATIHQTALLMIPVVFIVQGKPWNWKTLSFIILALWALVATEQFTDFLETALESTQYSESVSTWESFADDGANPIRVLVYSIPAILAFVGRRHIEAENNQMINLCVNMSIISAAIYLIAMMTSGIMIGRLPIYTSLYSFILLPYEIDVIFTKSSAKLVKIVMIICFLLYYYYLMHFGYGLV